VAAAEAPVGIVAKQCTATETQGETKKICEKGIHNETASTAP
jgi:hypothetical protein